MSSPLKTFICYAREDRDAVDDLRKHLKQAGKNLTLEIWDDGEIHAGQDWDKAIKGRLNTAQLILLFVSVDFVNSDYIEKTELQTALQRHRDGHATLIPIIVRRCDWQEHFGIGQFQALPKEARPIKSVDLSIREEMYYEVAQGIKAVVQEMRTKIAREAEQAEKQAAEAKAAQEQADAAAQAEHEKAQRVARQSENFRLKDETAWEVATEENTLHAYETYLEDGFTGHKSEAEQQVKTLHAADLKRRAKEAADKEAARKKAEEEKVAREAEEAQKAKVAAAEAKTQRELAFSKKYNAGLTHERAGRYTDAKTAFDEALRLHEAGFEITKNQLQQASDQAEKARTDEIEQQRKEAQRARDAKETTRKKLEQDAARKKRLAAEEAAQHADPFHDLMILIKGGSFDMGDTFGDGGDSAKPVHRVTMRDFHLCKYPITQSQWKTIMGNNPSSFLGDDNLPVETVSWDDAQAFIKKLNEKTGKTYRLPTEAEWEYAAREGGKKVRFGNGKDVADPKEVNFDATKAYKKPYSVVGEYRRKTTPVSQFKPNALGLYDMSGNLWEWCQDVWHDSYEGAPDNSSAWEQVGHNAIRVVRGGSWEFYPVYCRAASRRRGNTNTRTNDCGFRLAR